MKAVRAKKFLGQHFLINEGIAKKITDLISDTFYLMDSLK